MKKYFAGLLIIQGVVAFGGVLNNPKTLIGNFIIENDEIFFTQQYGTSYPKYRVEFLEKNLKKLVICPVNRVPICKSVKLTFVKKVSENNSLPETVFTQATFRFID